jgi:hypothetical protein
MAADGVGQCESLDCDIAGGFPATREHADIEFDNPL